MLTFCILRKHCLWVALFAAASVGCGRGVSTGPLVNLDDEAVQEEIAALRAGGGSGGGASAQPVSTGSGWGALKGVFKYQGAAPAPGYLSTGGKDAQTCGQRVLDESLLVDSATGGIANVAIFARRAPNRPKEGAAEPAEPVFDQKECLFLSHVMAVKTGVSILIKNSDPISHNTSISPPGDASTNQLLSGGGSQSYSFTRPQNSPVPVTCSIHPWMKAYLLPRGDSYFAVTGPNGSFQINDIPAGEEVEFQVWHEKVNGGAGGGLAAKSNWSNGRFTVTIPADGVEDLGVIEVPPAALQ